MPHPPRTEPSGATSPSVEGLPRQGRGEAGKGRGPKVAQQRVGRRAEHVASRARYRKRAAFRQPSSVPAEARKSSMPHRPRTEPSGATSPSVEGLPRQGRGEAGKGRGPKVAQQRVGRRAERGASRARYRKRAAERQPFFYIWRRGGGLSGASMHPTLPRYALQGQPTAVRFCSCRTVDPRRGFSSPRIRGVDHYNNRLHLPNVGQEKSRPVGGFFLYLAERGGFEPPRRYKRLPDFESGTFNHSATSPGGPRRTGDAHHTRK